MANIHNAPYYWLPPVTNPLDDVANAADPDATVGTGYGGFPAVKRSATTGPGQYRTQGIFRYQCPRPASTVRKTYNGLYHGGTTGLVTQTAVVPTSMPSAGGANTFAYFQIWSSHWSQGTWPGWNAAGDTPQGQLLTSAGNGLPTITSDYTWFVNLEFDFESENVAIATAVALEYRFALGMFDTTAPTQTGAGIIGTAGKKVTDERYLRLTRSANQGVRRTITMQGVLGNQVNLATNVSYLAAELWVARTWTGATQGATDQYAPGYRIVDCRGSMHLHPQRAPLAS
jgi:hypothetical protein